MAYNRLCYDYGALKMMTKEELAQLMLDLADAKLRKEQAANEVEQLNGILQAAYGESLSAAYAAKSNTGPFGSVTVDLGDGYALKASTPKKVKWEQPKLAALYASIKVSGENPDDYIDVEYNVQEKKFTAWPASIAEAFEPARTISTGKMTLELVKASVNEVAA